MKILKKALCSMLTLALMVVMFAGSGMEVNAEAETRNFEYQERWSVIGAERLDFETKAVSDASIGDIIKPEIREYEGYKYVNTEYASAVFDEGEAEYVIKSWDADPAMNEGKPYLFHYYEPVEGAGYFQYWFSASHAPGQSMNSGHPSSFANSTVSAEDILNDIKEKFSYSNCNVVGVYEDEARTKPISGTYTGGTSREDATDIYIEFDCAHADVPSVSNFCLTDASYDSETKKIKATFTFDYSKMDGQWLFVFETENCQSWGELDWGWAAYGSGVASADSVFEVVDENEPLVIKSGKFYLPENREYMFPIDMSPITIDPKDPTANVVVFPSQPSGGPCGGGETESANESASEPAQEVVQTPENNYAVFQEATIKNVEKAIEVAATNAVQAAATGTRAVAEPVKINTGVWISFKGNVYQKLQDSGLPVQITFMYKGERYRVDIPAGADLMSLVDENGYCGFLNLMAHFGGTKL